MYKANRNNTSEAIRLPNVVVDFLRDFSKVRGIDKNDLMIEMLVEYIAIQKVKVGC